jgi:hypothetical protein
MRQEGIVRANAPLGKEARVGALTCLVHAHLQARNSSPEVIRLAVLLYVKYPLSLRNVEDLLHERGIDISMRRYATGGTGSVRCLQQTSGGSG